MWIARTKEELAVEVWEKLDCESVGETEIEAIQAAVAGRFGDSAVDSPMKIARLLADEGAVLRHPEILRSYVRQQLPATSDRELRDEIDMTDLATAFRSMTVLERARADRKFAGDVDGLRRLRELALEAKKRVNEKIDSPSTDPAVREMNIEITEWLSHWLQVPMLFESWVEMRVSSRGFIDKFGKFDVRSNKDA